MDVDAEDAIISIAAEVGKARNDMIRYIIQEWLETNAYLPMQRQLDEDSEVDGTA